MYENACYTNTEDSCHYVYDTDYVEKCYTKYTRYRYGVTDPDPTTEKTGI